MTTVRCPRCHRDAPELTAFCVGCGAPLLLRDEAAATPVDAPVNLDRRSRGAGGGGRGVPTVDLPGPAATFPPRAPAHADELADVEKSHWDLGPIAAAADLKKEPVPAPEPNVARNVVAPPRRPPPTASTSTGATAMARPPPAPPPPPLPVPRPGAPRAAAPASAPPASSAARTTARVAPRPLDDLPGPEVDLPEPDVDAVEVHVARAEAWRRVVAWIVDGVPFVGGGGALAFFLLREVAAARGGPPRALMDVLDLVSAERVITLSVAGAVILALATYATLAHALGGATLGKRLVGIRVVGPDGGPPSPARSAVRSLLAVVSAGLLGLGFLLALFTRTGRALHDVLARTWVVKAP